MSKVPQMTTSSPLPIAPSSVQTPSTSALKQPSLTAEPTTHSNTSGIVESSPPSLVAQLHGKNVGNEWTQYTPPHKDFEYFYHRGLRLVTDYDILNHTIRTDFLSKYGPIAVKNLPFETHVQKGIQSKDVVAQVNHQMESYQKGDTSAEASRANYWKYLHIYPCHHKLPDDSKQEALRILHLAAALNLTNDKEVAPTPFSTSDIQGYMDFFNLFEKVSIPSSDHVADAIIITIIMFNHYVHLTKANNVLPTPAMSPPLKRIILKLACWAMPPNYQQRLELASSTYQQTAQQEIWESFLNQVRQERAAANVISGLLLTSSVAFLAIPDLADIAVFFITLSIALGLCSLVIGFNTGVDKNISQMERVQVLQHRFHKKQFRLVARAMEYHYTVLFLSVTFFALSLLASMAYKIYSIFLLHKGYAARSLFFITVEAGILVIFGTTIHLNQQLV